MNIQMVFFFSSLFLGVFLIFLFLRRFNIFVCGPSEASRRKANTKIQKVGVESDILKIFDFKSLQKEKVFVSDIENALGVSQSVAEDCLWGLVLKGKIVKKDDYYEKI